MKKSNFKRRIQRVHAKRRALERYGLSLNTRQCKEFVKKIQNKTNKAKIVDRQSCRLSRWFVWDEEKWLPVVYDKKRKTVVTFLPEGSLGETPLPPLLKQKTKE